MRPEDLDSSLVPWHRTDWSGSFVSTDGCDAADFTLADVEVVLQYGCTPDDWDGESAAVIRLKDGRFVSWECNWGPTGNGFNCEAYGGDSDIFFGRTEEACVRQLSERARELLRPVAR